MALNTTSFFAGVGAVLAAVTLGFAGGAMITKSPNAEPNRLERVTRAAGAAAPVQVPTASPQAAPVSATPADAPSGTAEASDTKSAPIRVISMAPQANVEQTITPQPQPMIGKDGGTQQFDNARTTRAEQRRERAERKMAQRRERSQRQEIQAAANAVRQARRDGELQEVSQRDEAPRLSFFGND